jgi:excisionase family DNA binding protein
MDNFALSSLIPSMNTSLSRIVCCKSQNENLSGARSAGRSRVPEKEDGASRTLFAQRRAGTPCPVASFAEAIGRPDTGGRVQDLAIERLTVAQAAARLGVSQDAVRKRIKRGTIEYEQDQDGRLHVYLDPLEVYETRQDRAADEPTERLAWAQHQEIEFLRRELETRTEEIRHRWQERRRVRGGRLDRRPYGREAHAARARWRERLPRRTAPPPDVPLPFRRASPSHTKAVSKTMLTRGNGNNASTAPPSNNHEAPRG